MHLEIGQIISQIIAFLIMLWVMKRFAWKPLLGVMEERRQKISAEFDLIDREKKQAQELLDGYHKKISGIEAEGRVIIQKAISEGHHLAKEIQKEAHEQAVSTVKKAKEEIELQMAKAKVQLKSQLADMIIDVCQKVIHEELDAEKQKKLITSFLDGAELK